MTESSGDTQAEAPGPFSTPIAALPPKTTEELVRQMAGDVATIRWYVGILVAITVLSIVGAIAAVMISSSGG